MMPGMSGLEVVEDVKRLYGELNSAMQNDKAKEDSHAAKQRLFVLPTFVIVTAHVRSTEEKKTMQQLGVDFIINKPFTKREIKKVLDEVSDKSLFCQSISRTVDRHRARRPRIVQEVRETDYSI